MPAFGPADVLRNGERGVGPVRKVTRLESPLDRPAAAVAPVTLPVASPFLLLEELADGVQVHRLERLALAGLGPRCCEETHVVPLLSCRCWLRVPAVLPSPTTIVTGEWLRCQVYHCNLSKIVVGRGVEDWVLISCVCVTVCLFEIRQLSCLLTLFCKKP